MKVPNWDCADGTPDEDHDWKLVGGDRSVGEGDIVECEQCGKQREPTEDDYYDEWGVDLAAQPPSAGSGGEGSR